MTPNGVLLLVANHTDGSVCAIDPNTDTLVGCLGLGENPTAMAITNDGDADDLDETVFVTRFFGEPITGGPGEGFDTGRQGVVWSFPLSNPSVVARITLSPFSNVGFTADRTNFCPQTAPVPPHNDIFCPDLSAPAGSAVITQDPQGAFPNQLASHVNLNDQIKAEPQPADPTTSLGRLFANDIVAVDATTDGSVLLIVSRGGNYVIRAIPDAAGKLAIGAPANVVRFKTGNIPNGVAISYDGRRAYVNNEVDVSVTPLDLETNTVLGVDIPSGEPPAPGTFGHSVLVGKLAFFTALGIPDNSLFGTPIREFNPLAHRGKASDNGWSSCGSCHPDGLSDNVTWIFAAGPRQTLPLDAFFAKDNSLDQKLVLWSALRGSNTDFNNNSRAVQGGCGFASDNFAPAGSCLSQGPTTPANPNIYDHGVTQGGSDALDAQSLWVQTVRPLQQPQPSDANLLQPGQAVFQDNCASCHGGPKWTKSQMFHRDNPALDRAGAGALALDPGVTLNGPQFESFTLDGLTMSYLEDVGTFDLAIDGRTIPLRSEGDDFRDGVGIP
jgi:hypothetical protein